MSDKKTYPPQSPSGGGPFGRDRAKVYPRPKQPTGYTWKELHQVARRYQEEWLSANEALKNCQDDIKKLAATGKLQKDASLWKKAKKATADAAKKRMKLGVETQEGEEQDLPEGWMDDFLSGIEDDFLPGIEENPKAGDQDVGAGEFLSGIEENPKAGDQVERKGRIGVGGGGKLRKSLRKSPRKPIRSTRKPRKSTRKSPRKPRKSSRKPRKSLSKSIKRKSANTGSKKRKSNRKKSSKRRR